MSLQTSNKTGGFRDGLSKLSKIFSGIADWVKTQLKGLAAKVPEFFGLPGADSSETDTKTTAEDGKTKGEDGKNKDGSSDQKSPFDKLFQSIEDGVSKTVSAVKIDFSDLGGTIKNIFKAVGQGIANSLQSFLGGLISKGANSLFGLILGSIFPTKPAAGGASPLPPGFPKITMAATGGTIGPGQVTLVGEEGPELIVPSSMSTVFTAAQTGRMMTRSAKGASMGMAMPAAVPETKVIINNHTGAPTTASRRRGPDGGDIIDVVVGRVAENLARGGQVADAAALRFGLTPQGT